MAALLRGALISRGAPSGAAHAVVRGAQASVCASRRRSATSALRRLASPPRRARSGWPRAFAVDRREVGVAGVALSTEGAQLCTMLPRDAAARAAARRCSEARARCYPTLDVQGFSTAESLSALAQLARDYRRNRRIERPRARHLTEREIEVLRLMAGGCRTARSPPHSRPPKRSVEESGVQHPVEGRRAGQDARRARGDRGGLINSARRAPPRLCESRPLQRTRPVFRPPRVIDTARLQQASSVGGSSFHGSNAVDWKSFTPPLAAGAGASALLMGCSLAWAGKAGPAPARRSGWKPSACASAGGWAFTRSTRTPASVSGSMTTPGTLPPQPSRCSSPQRVLKRVERGELSLTQRISYSEKDMLKVVSPVMSKHLAEGSLPLQDLCAAIVEVSDNTAANLLLKLIGGPPAVTKFARELGDEVTRLDRTEPELNTNLPGDPRDTTSPRAMVGTVRSCSPAVPCRAPRSTC